MSRPIKVLSSIFTLECIQNPKVEHVKDNNYNVEVTINEEESV